MLRLLKIERKTPVLKSSAFGCLRGITSINVTNGCMHLCVYCYARGFPGAPPKGEVHLYKNLLDLVDRELSKKRRLPAWISFSTASDPFQRIDEILKTTYSCMELILKKGIGISFLTKGYIPSDFIELFKKYPHNVKARIGIVSMSEEYRRLFEPFTAPVTKRIENIQRLIESGIEVSVRIDPVIPLITDSEKAMEGLFKRLREVQVKDASVSALVLRPSIIELLLKELPPKILWRIIRLYSGQPWQRVITSAKTRLLPAGLRKAIYARFKDVSRRYGLTLRICGCKNPDLQWECCNPWVEGEDLQRQMVLF